MSLLAKLLLVVTVGAPDVAEIERAYETHLGYTVQSRGTVSAELAASWDAPQMRGRQFSIMQPASGERVYLRFVEVDVPGDYVPMKTFGWNAIEMLVQDPDDLAVKLGKPGSPFRIVGKPRPLGPNSPIRAMQVVGPASEVLYLTRTPPGSQLGTAKTPVDRPFILIVGGRELDSQRAFWRDIMQATVGEPGRARMTVLNKAHGLDIETVHPLAMARLSPQYSIELDAYPASATERVVRQGELPPSMAMASFEVASLEATRSTWISPPKQIEEFPYNGRWTATVRGPAGELIELIGPKD